MADTLHLAELAITVARKPVKYVRLMVYPPDGRVTLVVPMRTRLDVARAYALSKLGWIRTQQQRFQQQARETPRQFVERESHLLWGRRYLLRVVHAEVKPQVTLDHQHITLTVRPGSTTAQRAAVLHAWHKALLHQAIPPLLASWEARLGVQVAAYRLQRMKTRWGSCTPWARRIRLNTELVKKPRDLLEYVLVHELVHLLEASHNARFVALLDAHYPTWRTARAELNALPLAAEVWQP
jgi:predicted metal-dependent hydrolase